MTPNQIMARSIADSIAATRARIACAPRRELTGLVTRLHVLNEELASVDASAASPELLSDGWMTAHSRAAVRETTRRLQELLARP
jgi:hypothetical protein